MSFRVLLLQARHAEDPAKAEERRSFAEKAGLPHEAVVSHDLLEGPPSLDRVRGFDALMIGGSGDFYVSKADLPHQEKLFDHLRDVVGVRHPMFASCFGFQCLVQALGGEIVFDPESTEVGTCTLTLTEAGREDPLLGSLPGTFAAQMGRKDRARSLPAGTVHLAASSRAPFQALRIEGAPIWATQFHPELDRDTNRGRFMRYLDGYAEHMSEAERDETLARFDHSPATEPMLARFVALLRS